MPMFVRAGWMIPSDNLVRWWNDNYLRAYRREVFSSLLAVHEYHTQRDLLSESNTGLPSSSSSVWSSGTCGEDLGEAAEAVFKCLRFHLREYAEKMKEKPDGRNVLVDPQLALPVDNPKKPMTKVDLGKTAKADADGKVSAAEGADTTGTQKGLERESEGKEDGARETEEVVEQTGKAAESKTEATAEETEESKTEKEVEVIVEKEVSKVDEEADALVDATNGADANADQVPSPRNCEGQSRAVASVEESQGDTKTSPVREPTKRKSRSDEDEGDDAEEKDEPSKRSRLTLSKSTPAEASSSSSNKPDQPSAADAPPPQPEAEWEHDCDCYTIRIGPPFQQKAYVLVMTHSGLFDVHYEDVVRSSQPPPPLRSRTNSSTTTRPRAHGHAPSSSSTSLKLSLQRTETWARRPSKKVTKPPSSRGSSPSSPPAPSSTRSFASAARWHDPSLTPLNPLATRVRQILEEDGLDFEVNDVRFCKMPICMV